MRSLAFWGLSKTRKKGSLKYTTVYKRHTGRGFLLERKLGKQGEIVVEMGKVKYKYRPVFTKAIDGKALLLFSGSD